MHSGDNTDKHVAVPDALKQGDTAETINVNGIEISWDVGGGTCNFRGIPVAMMWVDSTLAGLMSGVHSMVGTDRFHLALQSEGRKSVESDWLLISSFDDFARGFAELNLNAKVAGWGDWQLVSHDKDKRECIFRAYNNWEGGYQKALGVCWGSGMLAGKLAGICSKLFVTNCWASQTRFVAKGDPYDEFVVTPSDRNLEQEIKNLLGTDQATRADMAVALRRLQETEAVLRTSEQKFQNLVTRIPDGVYTLQFDPDGAMRFLYASPRFGELLGIPVADLIRDVTLAFQPCHPDDLASLHAANEIAIKSYDPFRWEGRFIVRGETRWFRISSDSERLANGGSIWHGVISDITPRKQAEAALLQQQENLEQLVAERTEQLRQAKETAELANQAKSNFLSRISHELRTPLGAILGYTQLLKNENDSTTIGEERESIEVMLDAGWTLLHIVDDLLDFSAIEAGKLQIVVADVQLDAVIDKCISSLQPLASRFQIRMAPPECSKELQVRADPQRLLQVLTNLVSNAIKYNRPGGEVRIHCSKEDEQVCISVSDTGKGIRQEDFPTLFDAFSRLQQRPYEIEGAGIGLAIAKQLIDLMKGHIGVESKLGEGSTFWILLKQVDASPPQPVAASIEARPAVKADSPAYRWRVLYIEDSPMHVSLMQRILKKIDGIEMLTASTAKLGLDLANVAQPDLILCDIGLPDMNGVDLIRRLKGAENTRAIPVVAVSAHAVLHEVERGMKAGFERYITKPFNIADIQAAIVEILGRAERLSR